ncbi:HET-domain-containing protein, partial [Aulographum hederae CBS 113979]
MLCTVCQNIDFLKYFQSAVDVVTNERFVVGPSEDAIHLGSLRQIYEKETTCSFCRLITSSIRCKWGNGYSWESPEDNDGSIRRMGVSQAMSSTSPKTHRIGIGVRRPGQRINPRWDLAGDIQLSSLSATEHGMPSLFHGRLVGSSQLDLSLVQHWIQTCESKHGRKCEVPAVDPETAQPDAFPDDLTVVDTRDMCLYHLPSGGRYIALSYCWPVNTHETFLTTRSLVQELFQPGSLKKYEAKFPLIIQDAINFAHELGERFLWIDALCIVQDDDTTKLAQIRQMDRVYGAATLTIVCAPPETADTTNIGLPGYRPGSRLYQQASEDIQGVNLMTSTLDVDLILLDSRWDQRAWTFQEHRLSRRKLYFTGLQLFFQC